MVQAFKFDGSGVSHCGRFVQTSKFVSETAANRFLVSAFGTRIPDSQPLSDDIDVMNSANISVCMAGPDLLALWEPGSAYRLSPATLDTLGVKTWREDLRGRAFSAHPKREPDGTLWNFGANPLTGELTIYCINRDGSLARSETLIVENLPSLHDFAITNRSLVFVMSPLLVQKQRMDAGQSFAQACEWAPSLGTRVLVVDKTDLSQRWYELPPSCVFHIANAWEDSSGVIRLHLMGAYHPMSLLSGWSIMYGEYKHMAGAFMTSVELDHRNRAHQEVLAELEGEFPVVDPSLIGRKYRYVLCVGRSSTRSTDLPGYDDLVCFDADHGATERFSYGKDWLVEEHALVPDMSNPLGAAQWVVGTALDINRKQTAISVFRASSVSDGPVAQALLPFALPLGLHGCYVPAF